MIKINLNRPANLILEDLIVPELPLFIPVRRDDGGHSHIITTGKKVLKHIPALYYFIHVLLERKHSDIETERSMYAKDYIRLYSRDIEPLKNKNYFRMMWGILDFINVVEDFDETRPNKYRKTAKAYFFRLTKDYDNSPIVQHQILVKKSIANKLNEKWNKTPKAFKKVDVIKALNKQLAHQYNALHSINFDSDSALGFIKKMLDSKRINTSQYNSSFVSINNIIEKKINVKQSSSCNRFFTPITSMPKHLRPFLKDNEGNSLIEIDFSSFNAFAVYKILNTAEPKYDSNAYKIAFENELDLYRRILSGGDFYNNFKEIFFPDQELSRDQIKSIVLVNWFNGKLNSRNKYRQHMLKRMPRISEIIDSLKSKNYENFSHVTMRMESELVNEIIYNQFVQQYPDAILYTVFDSFLIEQKYASTLQTMMTTEGSKYFNINCIVKAKKLVREME